MSGEARVVSVISIVLIGLVIANSIKEIPEEVVYETVLQTELRIVNSSSDIEPISSGLVKPILYSKIGPLKELPPFEEKNRFIDILLPAILVAKYEVQQDLLRLNELSRAEQWSDNDSLFLRDLSNTYRTDNLEALKQRLVTHPNSIVLAQAAVESGWGRSRFFKEANNLFGIWSYRADEPRIKASFSRPDYQVYLRKYGNVSESISDYFKTIARVPAYSAFRKKRIETSDINQLLPLLSAYSERKEEYVSQLSSMIRFNEFEQYDTYTIDPSYFITEAIK